MPITLKEVQLSADLASALYNLLPANPHPYANEKISFSGCANQIGVGSYWQGGSKLPAVNGLIKNTLEYSRDKFCPLIISIVKTSITYRKGKKNPLTKEEILSINEVIASIGFKIPELWSKDFLNTLPSTKPVVAQATPIVDELQLIKLKDEFIALNSLEPQPRGYAFQKFLNSFFELSGLKPRSPFRITGEEIDGSLELNTHTYLIEAKWQAKATSENDLLVFSGKVGGKATWSRGLFISYAGYSKEGLEAFARGKQTNMIGMDAQDLFFILDGRMSLTDALQAKIRRAGETNSFYVSVYDLSNQ
jgi:hypothetical protein